MANTGLLIVTSISRVASSLVQASKQVNKILYVQFHPPQNKFAVSSAYGGSVNRIYETFVSSDIENKNLDIRIIVSNTKDPQFCAFNKPIDLLLLDYASTKPENCTILQNGVANLPVVHLSDQKLTDENLDVPTADSQTTENVYDNVVLGGTFDRLHIGHKILLTQAVLRARKRLVVGVTDKNMVQSKKLPELILPVEERIRQVTDFLMDIDSTLNYEVVPIQDPFGPTKSDPNLDLIVVSEETMKGGQKVNELRAQNQLKQLDIHCISLIEMRTVNVEKETKLSSSNQRMDLLGGRYKDPVHKPHLPNRPYVIGMMGGIASGKSVMTQRFQKFGAKVIDCDKLAHTLYEPGKVCYEPIINTFGKDVVSEDGTINRQKLGGIVFGEPTALQKLNDIVWPELATAVKSIIKQSYEEQGVNVVILEAAILITARWDETICHEVWSMIIPPEEAVRRLIARNNLSESDAWKRVNAQPSNETIIEHSNIVFSSAWSYEYTQLQAEKAWKLLMDHLKQTELKSKC